VQLVKAGVSVWSDKTLIYLDPPYFVKGRDLYYDYYSASDHQAIGEAVAAINRQSWIVSYDNVEDIRSIYRNFRCVVYDVGYSARRASTGKEVMFFDKRLYIPGLVGPVKLAVGAATACEVG
jgi:DNA adenine methylase